MGHVQPTLLVSSGINSFTSAVKPLIMDPPHNMDQRTLFKVPNSCFP